MAKDHLLYRVEDEIAVFTINREARRNSLSPGAIALFLKYLDEAEKDPAVKAVCITGAGDSAFCVGADLGNSMAGGRQDTFRAYATVLKKISGFPKPTLAKVNGYCLAGGMGLMLACDMVIASDASRFGMPEVNVGLFPMMIGALIFRNISRKKAMELILTGEKIGAARALELDMINRVVPAGDLDAQTRRLLLDLSSKSPIGIRIGKQAFTAMSEMPFEDALDYLSGKLQEVASTEDAKEGITAFIEKRKPVYNGR